MCAKSEHSCFLPGHVLGETPSRVKCAVKNAIPDEYIFFVGCPFDSFTWTNLNGGAYVQLHVGQLRVMSLLFIILLSQNSEWALWLKCLAAGFTPTDMLDNPTSYLPSFHHSDVIMRTMTSQIMCLTLVYSTVYSDTDQRKHQSSESLAFVWGIHRWLVNYSHKGPITQKLFPLDDVIILKCRLLR